MLRIQPLIVERTKTRTAEKLLTGKVKNRNRNAGVCDELATNRYNSLIRVQWLSGHGLLREPPCCWGWRWWTWPGSGWRQARLTRQDGTTDRTGYWTRKTRSMLPRMRRRPDKPPAKPCLLLRAISISEVSVPLYDNSNAKEVRSGGAAAVEGDPGVELGWARGLTSVPLKFSVRLRADTDRYANVPQADQDEASLSLKASYYYANND